MKPPTPERNQCPCGCATPLPVIGGKRRIVCEAFMKTVPMEVRQGLYQPAGVDSRRVAVRTILQLAAKHKAAAKQLTFKL